jgi:uncharacterized protein (DUF433 family)
LYIHLCLNHVLLDAIQNGLAVFQSESQLRWRIHTVPLHSRHTMHCHTLVSDHRLDPYDKLHGGFLPRSSEPPAFGTGVTTGHFDIELKIDIKETVTISITMNWRNLIQITPGVRSGKPTLLGTRITPADILEYLAGGLNEDQILKDFPSLTREHVRAVLAYAAERERPST